MNASDSLSPAPAVVPAVVKKVGRTRRPSNILWRNGWAYFKKMVNGKHTVVALGTQDEALAKAKVAEMRRAMIRDELDKLKGPRAAKPVTCEELLERYEGKIQSVSEGLEDLSIRKNASAYRTFLRWAHGEHGQRKDVSLADVPAAVFGDELMVAKFKANYVASAGEDREAREARRRGAASILRQVKSMFSPQAGLIYRDLAVPDFSRFRAAAAMQVEDRVHLPIQNATLAKMWTAMAALREERPQLWLVHNLQKFLGLRNDEICQARVEWFKRAPWGQLFFSVLRTAYFEPKRSQGHIPLTVEVGALFEPFVKDKQPLDFLIEARHLTERSDLVNLEHAQWMRQFLPADDYAKAGYELRRWSAQVMEQLYGRDASKAFLRHTPTGVAERHYFEHWYPWRRLGTDVGVTIEAAKGEKNDQPADAWTEGASALAPMKPAAIKVSSDV